jgi:hypothetical protein
MEVNAAGPLYTVAMPMPFLSSQRALILLLSVAALCLRVGASALPGPVLPDGLGVNIHFTDPRPGEMKMLADGGFTWVRMDFSWAGIERRKGEYDFSAYDRLLAALDEYHIRPVFILDYSNGSYDHGLSPYSDEGRAAFAKWASASVDHFKGRGVIWEMYNEPNGGFWKPKADVDDYAKLALAVGKALRESAPEETYVGPAASTIDFKFLERCFQAGCLEYWSAVSVHPYRQKDPETAADEYRRLRLLISHYAPKDKTIPILSGEWGYSAAWEHFDEQRQGKYLPREFLINIANDVPLSIWYDWHDDGTNPKEPEHHFGTVAAEYHAGRDPVYDPKPAYVAAKTLTSQLRGFRYNKRLIVGDEATDYVLLFSNETDPKQVKLAIWSTARDDRKLTVPASAGAFHATDYLGKQEPDLMSLEAGGLTVSATDCVQYLSPDKGNDLLALAAAWERAPLEIVTPGGRQITLALRLTNPLAEPVTIWDRPAGPDKVNHTLAPGAEMSVPASAYADRSENPQPLLPQLGGRPGDGYMQETHLIVTNPLRVVPLPGSDGALAVRIEDPSGESFHGRLEAQGGLDAGGQDFELKDGLKGLTLRLRCKIDGRSPYRIGWRVYDTSASPSRVALDLPVVEYRPVPFSAGAYKLIADGDAKVASDLHLSAAAPPEGPPVPGVDCLEVRYHFDAGWKFARLAPQTDAARQVEGKPKWLAIWVFGDKNGNVPRIRFTDATGQTFQTGPAVSSADHYTDRIDWTGWRRLTFSLEEGPTHWGGVNDGKVHYPIRFDTLFLLDSPNRQSTEGAIYLAAPTLISE